MEQHRKEDDYQMVQSNSKAASCRILVEEKAISSLWNSSNAMVAQGLSMESINSIFQKKQKRNVKRECDFVTIWTRSEGRVSNIVVLFMLLFSRARKAEKYRLLEIQNKNLSQEVESLKTKNMILEANYQKMISSAIADPQVKVICKQSQ